MKCPNCKGDGTTLEEIPFRASDGERDWAYEWVRCTECKGKGYLTPEEAGLGKM